MDDREKVIKGIRKCLSHKPCSENGCPYENECAVEHLNDPLLRDALAMLKEDQHQIWEMQELNEYLQDKLKEQEAQLDSIVCFENGDKVRLWNCPFCKSEVRIVLKGR